MASDSFKFWDGYYEALQTLPDNDARGELVMGLCRYVFDGEMPEFERPELTFGFMVMRRQAEESRKIAATARENGRKSKGRPKNDEKKTSGITKKKTGFNEEKRSEASRSEASLLSEREATQRGTAGASLRAAPTVPPPAAT